MTTAESSWSNRLVERYNAIIAEGVRKTKEDIRCTLDIALAWSLNAKTFLRNVHGFSPNQAVFGKNPNYPSVWTDNLSALEGRTSIHIVRDNVNTMHAARKVFFESEASEMVRRALRSNVRSSGETKYLTGNILFYKSNNCSHWKGPGTVIGQEGQQVLVKHGNIYVCVHPYKLSLEDTEKSARRKEASTRKDTFIRQ